MLEFDAASKRFGSLPALDACSFVARPGRLTGFLGPNGAGKTTAMRTVFGLVELDSGAVRWQGAPIGPEQRARFGYMPEERGLYPRMRVRDQLVYLGRLCGRTSAAVNRTVDTWLERLGLSGRAGDRLDALSHGNQQRVQLIAALVNEPELLVLDEPFSGLDPLAMGSMSEMLAEVAAAGTTVLFSSHQLDLVEDICEDVVIINAGRVVRAGDLAELRAEVPQRVRDHSLPRVRTGLVPIVRGRGRRPARRAKRACASSRVPISRRCSPPRSATPIWCPSRTSLRRSPSCSGRRWRHERRAPDLARRSPRDPRARPFSRLPRVAAADAPGRRRRHRSARTPRHRPGHQGRRAHRGDASGARRHRAGTRRRRRHHHPHPPLRHPSRRRSRRARR